MDMIKNITSKIDAITTPKYVDNNYEEIQTKLAKLKQSFKPKDSYDEFLQFIIDVYSFRCEQSFNVAQSILQVATQLKC